jgi:hypothetical protein
MGVNSRPQRSVKPTLRLLEAQGFVNPHLIKSTNHTAKGTELVSGPRRSPRLTSRVTQESRATQNGRQSKKDVVRRKPEDPAQKILRASLARIYQEIDTFARRDKAQCWTQKEQKRLNEEMDAIHQILRQARMIRSLGQIPSKRQTPLQRLLRTFQTDRADVTEAVASGNADWSITGRIQKRFKNFCEDPNLMILSICAHSQTFRDAIFRSDEDSVRQKLPEWNDLFAMIKSNASSLELFAQVRDLTWTTALEHSNDHFAILLDNVFVKTYEIPDVQMDRFGIGPNDLNQIHQVGFYKEPGLWVLPQGKGLASRSKIEISATESTLSEFKKDDPALELYSHLDVLQQDIKESVVLPGYEYPGWLKPRDDKQPADPQFAGYENEQCFVCGKKGTAKSARDKTRPCRCTFEDLRRFHGQDPNALFELVDTERLGTGVRALQDIKAGTFIGEYVGEIYPTIVEDDKEWIPRYGHGLYLMNATLLNGASKGRKDRYNIDAARLGNWTRYINHSCKPNTAYISANIGQLQAITIKATRAIRFGEELTVNYGNWYFKHIDFGCKCGMSKCRRWVEEKVLDGAPRADTLADARMKGNAPSWAMENDNVPFDDPIAKCDLGLVVETGGKRKAGDDGKKGGSKRQRK